jgi:hypothetical protein
MDRPKVPGRLVGVLFSVALFLSGPFFSDFRLPFSVVYSVFFGFLFFLKFLHIQFFQIKKKN